MTGLESELKVTRDTLFRSPSKLMTVLKESTSKAIGAGCRHVISSSRQFICLHCQVARVGEGGCFNTAQVEAVIPIGIVSEGRNLKLDRDLPKTC